jgi:amino acid adenylation domain-containing protein
VTPGLGDLEVAAASIVLRCYSGASQVQLDGVFADAVRVSGDPVRVFADAVRVSGDPVDPVHLSGIPPRARLQAVDGRLELQFDGADVAEPYLRCMAEDLAAVHDRLRADPSRPAAELLPEPAAERLGPHAANPGIPEGSIPELFWHQVRTHGERLAMIDGDTVLTYASLGARVAGYAALLGPGLSGQRVGLLLDHGVDTVVAILATLTVGAVYVPLDPRYPAPRLHAMIDQAQVSAVLTSAGHAALAGRLAAGRVGVELLDIAAAPITGRRPDHPDHPPVDPRSPAYILHTSGSTGVPKGVVQTHRNVLHQVRLHQTNLCITPEDRISVVSSFGFDMAVTDTFSALLGGACCVPVDVRALGLAGLAEALRRHRVTIYHSTPTVFRYLADCLAGSAEPRLPELRVVVLGGEPVTREDVNRCRRHASPDGVLVNGYGATEISFAVQNHLPLADPGTDRATVVPIGYPLAGVRIGLLTADGSPSAVAGEIAISSDHLADYWNNPQEAAARFDTDHTGCRRYRTGDLARRLPDGRLTYLGRRDRQVKVRGFRVELTEIEHVLGAVSGVAHAAVVADREQLRAFVTVSRGTGVEPAAVRTAVARQLPDYMVPATVTVVPEIPLTPTGKVDARALVQRYPLTAPSSGCGRSSARIEQGLEGVIAAVWAAVLGRDDIDRHDRFFDIGGHSLLAAQVHHRLVERLGRRLPLTAIYAHPTIAGLAEYLLTGDHVGKAAGVADRMARRRAARTHRPACPAPQ